MISIKTLMRITKRNEPSIRRKERKLGIKPKYKSFTREHLEVEYTKPEARRIIKSYTNSRYLKYNEM